jgi:hypothetical protein
LFVVDLDEGGGGWFVTRRCVLKAVVGGLFVVGLHYGSFVVFCSDVSILK